MNKIYGDACDKYVNGVKLFGNEGKLYTDAAFTTPCESAVAEDLFVKGLIRVVVTGGMFVPVALKKIADGTSYVELSDGDTYCCDGKVVPGE